MAEGDTWMNALIGAIVTTLAGPIIPFAPIAGGAVSGYLEGRDGARVGAYSGLIALIPTVLFAMLIMSILGGLLVGLGGLDGFLVGSLGVFVFVVLLIFGLIYVVGLSILGGYLGVYLKEETNL